MGSNYPGCFGGCDLPQATTKGCEELAVVPGAPRACPAASRDGRSARAAERGYRGCALCLLCCCATRCPEWYVLALEVGSAGAGSPIDGEARGLPFPLRQHAPRGSARVLELPCGAAATSVSVSHTRSV